MSPHPPPPPNAGEDPYLGSQLVGPAVKGIQSNGVFATAKHYILNNQEHCRGNMSADVDERTIQEIYHPPFAAAVEAGVGAIMYYSYTPYIRTLIPSCPHTLTLMPSHAPMHEWAPSAVSADSVLDPYIA
jgi:hypothetical protein